MRQTQEPQLTARLLREPVANTEPVEIRIVAYANPADVAGLQKLADSATRYLQKRHGWFSVEFRHLTDTEADLHHRATHIRMVDELDEQESDDED